MNTAFVSKAIDNVNIYINPQQKSLRKKRKYTLLTALAFTTAALLSSSCSKNDKTTVNEQQKIEQAIKQQKKEQELQSVQQVYDSVQQVQAQIKEKQVRDSLNNSKRVVLLDNIPLFNDMNKEALAKFTRHMKIKDIEYTKEQNGVTQIFAHSANGYTYNMRLGKSKDGAVAGLVSKESEDGTNQLFLARMELVETNKDIYLQIGSMEVVKNGVVPNSETTKKGNTTTISTVTKHSGAVTKRKGEIVENTVSGGGSLFEILADPVHVTTSEFVEKGRTKQGINQISEFIVCNNVDGCKYTTLALTPTTGKITTTGFNFFTPTAKPDKKYADKSNYILVNGPHNTKVYIDPRYVAVDKKGLTYLDGYNGIGKLCSKNYKTVSTKKELENLITLQMRRMSDEKSHYDWCKLHENEPGYNVDKVIYEYETHIPVIQAAQQLLAQLPSEENL